MILLAFGVVLGFVLLAFLLAAFLAYCVYVGVQESQRITDELMEDTLDE